MREKQQKTPYETYLSSNVAACLTKMFTFECVSLMKLFA